MKNTRQVSSISWTKIGIGIFSLLASVFSFLCLIGAFSFVGETVKRALVGSFGLAVYGYSISMALLSLALIFKIRPKMQVSKMAIFSLIILFGIFALHSYTSSPYSIETNYGEYLFGCYDGNNTAGGALFGLLTYPIMKAISPVGAIVVFVALFFLFILFVLMPIINNNFVQTTSPSQKIKGSKKYKFINKETEIELSTIPTLTNFSKENFDVNNSIQLNLNIQNKQSFNKKQKGTSGYIPLDQVKDVHEPEVNIYKGRFNQEQSNYSKSDLAKKIAFGNDSYEESMSKFNSLSNPGQAFDINSYKFTPIQKFEMDEKLKTNDQEKVYQDFFSKYGIDNEKRTVQEIKPEEEVKSIFETEINSEKPLENYSNFSIDDFITDEANNFAKKYEIKPEYESIAYDEPQTNDITEAEEEVKEVVKPKTVHHIDIPKQEQNLDNSNVNTGILGALNFSNQIEEHPIKQEVIIESDAYEKGNSQFNMPKYPSIKSKKDSYDLEKEGYKPIDSSDKRIPYAFSNTSIYENNDNKKISISSIQNDDSVTTRSTDNRYISTEDMIKREKAKAALKETPKVGKFEQALLDRQADIEKDKQDKKAQKMLNKMQSIDTSAQRVVQTTIEEAIEQTRPRVPYVAPPIDLLVPPAPAVEQDDDYSSKSQRIVDVLSEFGIQGEVINYQVGPTFTMYKVKVTLPRGKTIGFVSGLEKDFQMRIPTESVRIIAPIPGENAIGLEIPNKKRRNVNLSEIILSKEFKEMKEKCAFALGENIYGDCGVVNISKMPHALIAGATGQGKSCCINSLIVSLLYRCSPEDVRLILIDPKKVEFSVYRGIPHLLIDEIITDTDKAIRALNWAITEMERRLEFLMQTGYRDIEDYNLNAEKNNTPKMPRILIVVDEFADLMSTGKKNVENSVDRIARLARAVGINLVLATQRPSVDVISGTIKNNFPTRVACKVTSSFDSKTVLDQYGADKLLGYGDLLYMTPGKTSLERMQGAFVQNDEVKRVVDFVIKHNDAYFDNSIKEAIFKDESESQGPSDRQSVDDMEDGKKIPEFYRALKLGIDLKVCNNAPVSISLFQRKLGLGFAKAGRVYDMLDNGGYLTPDENNKKMKYVNITYEELEALKIADGVEDVE